MTSCTAANCQVQAVAAVQWLDLRLGGGTRAEPVCAGHEQALARLIRAHARDPWIVQAKIITLSDYAARLARTVRVTPADAFADLMRDAYDAGAIRFPPPG